MNKKYGSNIKSWSRIQLFALLLASLSTTSLGSSFTPPTPPVTQNLPQTTSLTPKTTAAPKSSAPPLALGDSVSGNENIENADFVVSDGKLVSPNQSDPMPDITESIPLSAKSTALPSVTDKSETSEPPSTEVATKEVKSLLGAKAKPPGWLRSVLPNFPWHKVPEYLTFMRCASIPVLVYLFYTPGLHTHTSLLFALASFTDWLDGFLARRWDIESAFGAFLDPVSDKLMVSTCLILLTGRFGAKIAIPASIILAREIAVSALREWMAQRGERDSVKVGTQGKVKTALTMVALTILLAIPVDAMSISPFTTKGKLESMGLCLLYASTFLTVTSGSLYFKSAAPALRDRSTTLS